MINFGIIGCGAIANVYGTFFEKSQEAQLLSCCDSVTEKAKSFAAKYGGSALSDYHELLRNPAIDAVVICTPHFLHKEMTLAGLAAGKHVLCEKPMALSPEEAKAVISAVEQASTKYAVCFQNRFNDASLVLKKQLAVNEFGQLKGVKCNLTWHRSADYYRNDSWRGTWQGEGGGVLINQAIHLIDLISWLVGTPQKIKGKIMTTLLDDTIEVEDAAMATGVLAGGQPVIIQASNDYSADPSPELVLDFEQGTVRLLMNALYVNDQRVGFAEATTTAGKAYWGNGHSRLIQAFIAEIQGQTTTETNYLPTTDAINALKIVTGIYQSDETNDWVKLTQD